MNENSFDWKPYLFFAAICVGLGLTAVAGAKLLQFI